MTRLTRVLVVTVRRTVLLLLAIASLALYIDAQQGSRSKRPATRRASKRKAVKPPVTHFVADSGGRELIVRLLDIGQGDATYIRNGASRIIIDGGSSPTVFGRYLDSLSLNNTTRSDGGSAK